MDKADTTTIPIPIKKFQVFSKSTNISPGDDKDMYTNIKPIVKVILKI